MLKDRPGRARPAHGQQPGARSKIGFAMHGKQVAKPIVVRPAARPFVSGSRPTDGAASGALLEGGTAMLVATIRNLWEQWGLGSVRARQVFDLGCGDGRALLDVCQSLPACRGVGIGGARGVERAQGQAQLRGLSDRCEFRVGDPVGEDLAGATAVVLSQPPAELAGQLEALPRLGLAKGTVLLRMGSPLPATTARLLLALRSEAGVSVFLLCLAARARVWLRLGAAARAATATLRAAVSAHCISNAADCQPALWRSESS